MNYQNTLEYAQQQDANDPLKGFRDEFHIPKQDNGDNEIYFVGNSLGLQPKLTSQYLNEELTKWQKLCSCQNPRGLYT